MKIQRTDRDLILSKFGGDKERLECHSTRKNPGPPGFGKLKRYMQKVIITNYQRKRAETY